MASKKKKCQFLVVETITPADDARPLGLATRFYADYLGFSRKAKADAAARKAVESDEGGLRTHVVQVCAELGNVYSQGENRRAMRLRGTQTKTKRCPHGKITRGPRKGMCRLRPKRKAA